MQTQNKSIESQFAEDVKRGLSSFPKFLSFKDFYNKEGSQIFQEIMKLEDYYLTNCEYEILENQKSEILTHLPASFDLVELGAGDGLKTKILLHHFLAEKVDFQYLPVDISLDILEELQTSLAAEMPNLAVNIWHDDYFGALQKLSDLAKKPKVVLFLGSNIGNFKPTEAEYFLKKVRNSLNKGDFLLLGIDLVKNPETILKAYTDKNGVHASFNYNLLHRINEDLGANFQLENFQHYSNYLPQTGERGSYLMSKVAQKVWIEALQMEVSFDAWESVFMAISQKYTYPQIEKMAQNTDFEVKKHFLDSKKYYTNSLWEAI